MRRASLVALVVALAPTPAGTIASPSYDLIERARVLDRVGGGAARHEIAAALHLRSETQARFAAIVAREADRQGVPTQLALAIAWSESAFRPGAIGPRTPWGRAYGGMQVLASTARTVEPGVTARDLLRPETGARIGVAYLRRALDQGWAIERVCARYHGGPNTRLHGPRTRAYCATVNRRMARLGGARPVSWPAASGAADHAIRNHQGSGS